MKKTSTFLLLVLSLVLYYSFSGNPPNGRTGAPGESTCGSAGCHSPSNPSFSGNIVISGLDNMILPGQTYPLIVTITDDLSVAVRAGFQMTNVGPDDDTTVGTFSNVSSNATITVNGNRTYVEHSPADFFTAGIVTYTVDWTAPNDLSDGDVVDFYGISVIANGSSSSNDLVVDVQENATIEVAASQLELNLTNVADPLCFNESNGTATVEITGGTSPFDILWSNGEMGETAVTLPSGNNSVVVTDAANVSETINFTLDNPLTISDNLAVVQDVSCLGEATGSIIIEPSGGTGNLDILWNTGEMTNGIFNKPAGNYSVNITDENNCMSTFQYTISDDGIIVNVSIATPSEICFGEFGNLTAVNNAVNPFYTWSSGDLTQTVFVESGDYFVTVTDENGCSSSASYISPYTEEMIVDITITGNNEPYSATALPDNGVEPYQYLWSTNETDQTIDNLIAGNYFVTVSDLNSCTASNQVEIINDCVYILDTLVNNPSCPGSLDGSIMVDVEFETDDIVTYEWNTGDLTSSISNLSAGIYTLTFTNTSCTDSLEFTLVDPPMIEINFNAINPSEDELNSGSIQTNVNNAVDTIIYLWSTAETTSSIENLSEGIYSLTVTDGNNCQVIDSIELVNSICDLTISLDIDSIFCIGDLAEASVSHNSTLGLNPKITWSTGDTTATVDSLSIGDYDVIVSDDTNCSDTISFSIVAPLAININVDSLGIISCEDSLALIQLSINWEHEPFDFLWSNGDNTAVADSLIEGAISVIITNAKGCIHYDTFTIEKQTYGPPSASVEDITVYLDSMGVFNDIPMLNTILTGSCEDSVYVISDALDVDCSTSVGETQDVYVYNFDEIIDTIQVKVTILDTIAPYAVLPDIGGSIEICGESNFGLEITSSDIEIIENCSIFPLPPTIFLDFSTNVSGIICDSFNIMDISGNSTNIIVCKEITVYDLPTVEYDITDVSCFGESDGCIEIEIEGGTPPYEFIGGDLCNISGGSYSYSIVDANGCATDFEVEIIEPLLLEVTEVDKQNEFPGESDGFIEVDITGGTEPYTFSWTENGVEVSTQEDLINFPASQYKLTVIDANGCMTMLSSFIDMVSSLENDRMDEVKIVENPINDRLTLINLPVNSSLEVISFDGTLINSNRNIQSQNLEINSAEWVPGIYACVINYEGKRKVVKFVKN